MNMPASSSFLLTDLLRPETIQLNLTSTRRDDVLEEMVQLIPEIAGNTEAQNTLLRALKEREQLHSTSIGDGIAIPHARNALVGLVPRPVIVFGRHPHGINFGALDGELSKMFFLITSPTVTQHLAILARLSRLLRNPVLRKNLLAADKREKVLSLIREAEESAQFRSTPSQDS